jgi:hypothetical protein
MPTHMKSILAMLAFLTATIAPSAVKVIDEIVHSAASSIPGMSEAQNLSSATSDAQVKSITSSVRNMLVDGGVLTPLRPR